MKNLIAELLFKLAQKEEESKELCAQVEALEIIVTAMLRNMAQNDQQRLIDQVEGALYEVKPDANPDPELCGRNESNLYENGAAARLRKEVIEASSSVKS